MLLNFNEKACALKYLITAYQFIAKYERNSIAVGRAVSNLANEYVAMDDINKALECYKIAFLKIISYVPKIYKKDVHVETQEIILYVQVTEELRTRRLLSTMKKLLCW